jgi:hypothetical protein
MTRSHLASRRPWFVLMQALAPSAILRPSLQQKQSGSGACASRGGSTGIGRSCARLPERDVKETAAARAIMRKTREVSWGGLGAILVIGHSPPIWPTAKLERSTANETVQLSILLHYNFDLSL